QLSSRGGDDDLYRPGWRASRLLAALDLDVAAVGAASSRPLLAYCIDWTEQRHHLAGALGAAIATRMFERGWIERASTRRAVRLTDVGRGRLDRLQLLATA